MTPNEGWEMLFKKNPRLQETPCRLTANGVRQLFNAAWAMGQKALMDEIMPEAKSSSNEPPDFISELFGGFDKTRKERR